MAEDQFCHVSRRLNYFFTGHCTTNYMKIKIESFEELGNALKGIVQEMEYHRKGDASKNSDGTDRKILATHKLTKEERKTVAQLHKAAEVYNERVDKMQKLSDAIEKKRDEMWAGFTKSYGCHQGQISKDGSTLTVYECGHHDEDEEEESESPSIEDLLESLSR